MRALLLAGVIAVVGCNAKPVPAPAAPDPHLHVQTKSVGARPPLPDVMVLVDRSDAAAPYLADVRSALTWMLTNRGTIARFGLSAFPASSADTCSLGAEEIEPVAQTEDYGAPIQAQADLIISKLANLQSGGTRDVASGIGFFAQAADFANPSHEHYILLLTTGMDACGGDVAATVRQLRSQNIRTIVVAVGPEATGYDDAAVAGGFQAICAMQTDAECGPRNTCDVSTGVCQHAAYSALNETELQGALDRVTATGPAGDSLCNFVLDVMPSSAARVSVLLDGVATPAGPDTWALMDGQVVFQGAACDRIHASSTVDPLDVELIVDDRP